MFTQAFLRFQSTLVSTPIIIIPKSPLANKPALSLVLLQYISLLVTKTADRANIEKI